MEFTHFNVLYPEIRSDVPDASVPTLDRAIRFAARMLCVDGRVLTRELDAETPVENIDEYELTIPEHLRILELTKVMYKGVEIRSPSQYTWERNGILKLVNKPGQTTPLGLRVWARLAPSRTAKYLEDNFLDDHYEILREGALSQIYAMPGKPWSDDATAQKYDVLFSRKVAEARSRAAGETASKDSLIAYGGL